MSTWINRKRSWLGKPRPRPLPEPSKVVEPVEPEEYAVLWVPIHCPRCKSTKGVPAYSSRKGNVKRYHKCKNCGCRFASIEMNPTEQNLDGSRGGV